LTKNFGLEPLIDKRIAIVADARLGSRIDQAAITERLLSISGEDTQTIDRKYQKAWTGKLPTRFLILTNELPRLTDSSGALPSRFVLLSSSQSFYGREDPDLTKKLLTELPSILNWAIDGWDRLQRRGCFTQPAASEEMIGDLYDLSSPVGLFVEERCDVDPKLQIAVDLLFRAWTGWCEKQGRTHPGTKQTFGRDLRAVVPGLRTKRPGSGTRERFFEGIGFQKPEE
jgi:putative DNA primase/helicase